MNYRKSLYRTIMRYRQLQFLIVLLMCGAFLFFICFEYWAQAKHQLEDLLTQKENELFIYMTGLEKKSEQYFEHYNSHPREALDTMLAEEIFIDSFSLIHYTGESLYQYRSNESRTKNTQRVYYIINGYRFVYDIDLDRLMETELPKNTSLILMRISDEQPWSWNQGIMAEEKIDNSKYTIRVYQRWSTVISTWFHHYQLWIYLLLLFPVVFRLLQLIFYRKARRTLIQLHEQLKDFADMTLEEIIHLFVDSPYKEPYALLNYFKRFCENNKKNMENQLKSLDHELEQARYSNQAKSLFLANMSHEMRTPLNSIIGYTQLIYKIGFNPIDKVKEYIGHISVSSDILLQKINDILDLAKIEANQFELQATPQNLRTLVKEVYDLLLISANKKGLQFYYSIDPQIPNYLMIDPTRFKQIIINLCSNAIKFTNKGYVKLEIELFGYINNAIVIDYRVIDTGEGIKEEDLNKIFVPFVQVGSRAKGHQGTGLGLTITRDLIKLMGGDIQVTSKENVGSIFSFTTIFDVAEGESEPVNSEYLDDEIATIIKDRKILIVEDNPINQMLIKEIFKVFQKPDVDLAEDGLEAIEMCEKTLYDIVFMDIQMPRCDGVEATLKLREMESYEKVPIIALTANAFSEQVNQYLSLGMTDYLQKPLDIVRLKQVLVNYLSTE